MYQVCAATKRRLSRFHRVEAAASLSPTLNAQLKLITTPSLTHSSFKSGSNTMPFSSKPRAASKKRTTRTSQRAKRSRKHYQQNKRSKTIISLASINPKDALNVPKLIEDATKELSKVFHEPAVVANIVQHQRDLLRFEVQERLKILMHGLYYWPGIKKDDMMSPREIRKACQIIRETASYMTTFNDADGEDRVVHNMGWCTLLNVVSSSSHTSAIRKFAVYHNALPSLLEIAETNKHGTVEFYHLLRHLIVPGDHKWNAQLIETAISQDTNFYLGQDLSKVTLRPLKEALHLLSLFRSALGQSSQALLDRLSSLSSSLNEPYRRLLNHVHYLRTNIAVITDTQTKLTHCIQTLTSLEEKNGPLSPHERAQKQKLVDYVEDSKGWVLTWSQEMEELMS